ncbi:MAG: hypothetical protein R6U29_04485, partial [Desulfosudaceae bacterium]
AEPEYHPGRSARRYHHLEDRVNGLGESGFYSHLAPFGGRLQPSAKFLELGLSPSDSEKFLTQPVATGFSPKGAHGAHKNHFHRVHFTGNAGPDFSTSF